MKVISKNVLAQKMSEGPREYVSKNKILYWIMMYGYDIKIEEGTKNESNG